MAIQWHRQNVCVGFIWSSLPFLSLSFSLSFLLNFVDSIFFHFLAMYWPILQLINNISQITLCNANVLFVFLDHFVLSAICFIYIMLILFPIIKENKESTLTFSLRFVFFFFLLFYSYSSIDLVFYFMFFAHMQEERMNCAYYRKRPNT